MDARVKSGMTIYQCRCCEERLIRRSSKSEGGSDEATQLAVPKLDCFASLAVTIGAAA